MQDVGNKRENAWLKVIKVHIISNTYQHNVYPVLVLIIWHVMKKQFNMAIYWKKIQDFPKKNWISKTFLQRFINAIHVVMQPTFNTQIDNIFNVISLLKN